MACEHRATWRWRAEIRPPPLHGAGPKLPELEACEGRGPGACGHRMLLFPRADRHPQRIIPDVSGLEELRIVGTRAIVSHTARRVFVADPVVGGERYGHRMVAIATFDAE